MKPRMMPLVALGLVGCVTYAPPQTSAPATLPPAPVRASFDRTWSTVIDFFADNAIPVKTIDRASGYIAAERIGAGNNAKWADCGKLSGALMSEKGGGGPVAPQQALFNVRVRGDSVASTVQVVVRWTAVAAAQVVSSGFGSRPSNSYDQTVCVTTNVWEREAIREITRRAETR
ncbi:MAG TPA: hypothetical protein VF919_03375 [Gemmatimonadales bacterium]